MLPEYTQTFSKQLAKQRTEQKVIEKELKGEVSGLADFSLENIDDCHMLAARAKELPTKNCNRGKIHILFLRGLWNEPRMIAKILVQLLLITRDSRSC